MPKLLAISLAFWFFALWLRPLAPFVDYAVNKERIAQTLCENKDKPELECHGKCHLRKEVKKAAEATFDLDHAPTEKKNDTDHLNRINLYSPESPHSISFIPSEPFVVTLQGATGRLVEWNGDVPSPPPQLII